MKTFSNFRKLSLFIVWVLVVLLVGIGTTIYANEDSEKEAKKDEIEIKLEPGEIGEGYCRKLTAPKKIKIAKWILKEGSSLPDGLELSSTGYLFGKPTEQKKFTFDLQGFDESSKPIIDKDSNKPITYKMSLNIKPKIDFSQSENLRMITGFEISRASCTTGGEKAFVDLYLSQPLPIFSSKKTRIHRTSPFKVWGNVRLTSIAQQNSKSIGTASSDYFSGLSDLKLNQMSQAAEFLVGLEFDLWRIKSANQMYTLGLIAAAGGSTPLASEKDPQLVVYAMPPIETQNELKKRYTCTDDDFKGKNYVSFVPEDRDRFYRQYYFGIRLKTYMNEAGISSLPAMLDTTFGINDAASGGGGRFFKKAVFRIDGFLPFKILDVPIYIFGTVVLNNSDETIRKPLILGAPVPEKPSNSNEILILTEPANNRDFFKIGIGVDLYKIFMSGQDKVNKLEEVKTTLDELKKEKQDTEDTRKNLEEKLNAAEDTRKKYEDELKKLKALQATNPQSGTQN